MGWANCGTDSEGRLIGYAHEAVCDHHSCETEIDRGLAYACGDMHGTDEYSCEKYFCPEHLWMARLLLDREDVPAQLCGSCVQTLKENSE